MRIELVILLMVIFCSCGPKRTYEISNSDSVIEIDLLSEPKSTIKKLSDFAENVEYIPLQTTENSLLGEFVRKIISIDNRIYIKNGGLEGEIMCFDMDGRFLFKLDNKGRGPGEYTSIFDFDVSSDNEILTLLSLNKKLLIYGISETGFTFERSVSLKDPFPWMIDMVPETDYGFLAVGPWNRTASTLSLLINTNGDTIHFKPNCYGIRQDRGSGVSQQMMLVYSVGKIVCFREAFSDTVFYVDAKDNSFKPRIIFDAHGTLVTPEMWGHPERIENHTISLGGIFETSRYVFYNYYSESSNRNCILFDKTTKEKHRLDIGIISETIANIPRETYKIKLNDDLFDGPDFMQNIMDLNTHCSGGKLFSLVEAITLKKHVAGEDFKNARVSDPKKKEKLKKIADSLNETDNPVLIVVTPKKITQLVDK